MLRYRSAMATRVPHVPPGPVPFAEEILKKCVLKPNMGSDYAYSHLANMMVFYDPGDTKYTKKPPSRRAAMHGSPIQVVVNHYSWPHDAKYKFLGVTRDHLKDGTRAKVHTSAAGMFSVCVDGIVTIIQPRSSATRFKLGDYVYVTEGTFEIKDKHMKGRLLQSISAKDFMEKDSVDETIIGQIVEKRASDVDEVRVKLLPFGLRAPDMSSIIDIDESVVEVGGEGTESEGFLSASSGWESETGTSGSESETGTETLFSANDAIQMDKQLQIVRIEKTLKKLRTNTKNVDKILALARGFAQKSASALAPDDNERESEAVQKIDKLKGEMGDPKVIDDFEERLRKPDISLEELKVLSDEVHASTTKSKTLKEKAKEVYFEHFKQYADSAKNAEVEMYANMQSKKRRAAQKRKQSKRPRGDDAASV